jgi:hypothetical protein
MVGEGFSIFFCDFFVLERGKTRHSFMEWPGSGQPRPGPAT